LQCKGASFGGGLHDLGLETSISSGFAPLKIGSGISFAIRVVFFFLITIAATYCSKNLIGQRKYLSSLISLCCE
jgi:tagatose-1,6-bisphosphate aldolase non-catalytic subunit AgaZ/GatZ